MAAGDRTAVFRAIGDFTRLVRDAKRAKSSMGDLGDAAEETGEKLDGTKKSTDKTGDSFEDSDKKANRFARTIRGLSTRLQGPQKLLERLKGSKAHDIFDKMSRAGDRLGGTLKGIRNKLVVFSTLALGATAAVGPVLGLVGAVVSLSGAVGVLPAVMGAMQAASAVLKVAFMGVDDVLKNIGGTAEEFNESIKDLPPSMQQAARAARGLLPGLKNIRKEIQGKFWDGLAKPMEQLANKWFPIARYQGGKLAGTFNKMAKEAAGFLTQQKNVDDWDHSLHNVNRGWEAMIKAVRPLLRVLTDVFAVSSEFLPDMGKGVAGVTQRFSDFVRRARETGQLKRWIADGIEAVKDLGSVLRNVGRIFGAVFDAGEEAGAGFLETLKKITDKFADFLESSEGQRVLTTVFEQVGRAVEAVLPILKTLASAIADVLPIFVAVGERIAPGVEKLINGLRDAIVHAKPTLLAFGEAIGDLLGAIGEMGPLLGEIVEGLVWAAMPLGVLADVIRFLADMFDKLPQPVKDATGLIIGIGVAALVATGLVGKLGKMAAGVLGTFGKFVGLLNKIPGLNIPVPGKKGAPAAGAPAAPVSLPDVDVDKSAGKAGDKAGKSFLSRMGAVIKRGAKGVGRAVSAVFSGVGKVASGAAKGVATAFSWAKPALATAIRGIGTAIVALGTALRALGAALLANPIVLIIAGIAAAALLIITNWDTVKQWLAAFWSWLTNLFTVGLNWVKNNWTATWNAVSGVFTAVWNAIKAAALAVWNALKAAFTAVLDALKAAWSAAWNAIKSVAESVWNAIKSAVTGAINAVKSVIETVLGIIRGIWDKGWRAVSDVVTGVWDTIKSVVGGAVGVVKDLIQSLIDAIAWLWDKAEKAFNWIIDKTRDAIVLAKELIGLDTTAQPVPGTFRGANKPQRFGKGGLIGGRGNADNQPILGKRGEYVSPVATVKKWLPWLRAMNPYDSGGLQLSMSDMLSGAAPAAPAYGMTASSGAATAGQVSTTAGIRDVHVTQIVNNPLPEKPSETASKRTGRAARLGVMSAIGGVA